MKLRMTLPLLLIIVVTLVGCGGGGGGGSTTTLFSDNFNSYAVSTWSTPQGGWEFGETNNGTWSISDTGTDGSRALQAINGASNAAQILNGDNTWSDFSYSADVKLSNPNSFGGIHRSDTVDPKYTYQLLLNPNSTPSDSIVQLYNGTVLGQATLTVNTGTFYTLKLVFASGRIQGYVNGTLYIDVANPTAGLAGNCGKIGLYFDKYSNPTAYGYFDNIVVTTP